jgi:hypothetical protein
MHRPHGITDQLDGNGPFDPGKGRGACGMGRFAPSKTAG